MKTPEEILAQLIEEESRPFNGSLDVHWRTPDDCRRAKDRLTLLTALRDSRAAISGFLDPAMVAGVGIKPESFDYPLSPSEKEWNRKLKLLIDSLASTAAKIETLLP